MVSLKLAIIGIGRLGSLIARLLPTGHRKLLIGRQRRQAQALADEVGGVAGQLASVRGADLIFVVVPADQVVTVLEGLLPHVGPESLIINMSTETATPGLQAQFPTLRLGAAKVMGQAREIANGSTGLVVLDHLLPAEASLLAELLQGLGPSVIDDEMKVLTINSAVVEEMLAAEGRLRARLTALGLGQPLIETAIRTTGPGVLRSLARGDAGPFVQTIAQRLRAGQPGYPKPVDRRLHP